MSYRFMRVLVMFDLPVQTIENRRNYRRFTRELLKNGFIMMQESIYTKMLLTPSQLSSTYASIRREKPPKGIVQIMTITEKQFSQIEYLVGEEKGDTIDSDERLVIL